MKKITTLALMLTTTFASFSQDWYGTAYSNYGGVDNLYFNPANLARSPYLWHFRALSYGAGFANNYARWNAPLSIHDWAYGNIPLSNQNVNGNLDFQQNWVQQIEGGKGNLVNLYSEFRLPAFMFNTLNGQGFAFGMRTRRGFQSVGFDSRFLNVLRYGTDSASAGGNPLFKGDDAVKYGQSFNIKDGAMHADAWDEFAFSYGGVLSENKRHILKGGITGKINLGYGGFDFNTSNLKATLFNKDSMSLSGQLGYGHTDIASTMDNLLGHYGPFSGQINGMGLGLDLGFAYEHRTEQYKRKWCPWGKNRTDYDFKFSAAITDIGRNWYTDNEFKTFSNVKNFRIPANLGNNFDVAGKSPFGRADSLLNAVSSTKTSDKYYTSLPTALNVTADWRLNRDWFLGVNYTQNLKAKDAKGLITPSSIVVTPRYEKWWFELAAPVSLNNNFTQFNVGAYLKLGPVYFGTNNIGGLLKGAADNPHKAGDFYVGMAFGLATCPGPYKNVVQEKYYDTTKKDTVKKEIRDTVKIKDTVKIEKRDTVGLESKKPTRDTMYVYKDCPDKAKIEALEAELKKRDAQIKVLETTTKGKVVYVDKPETLTKNKQLEEENAKLKAEIEGLKKDNGNYKNEGKLNCKTCEETNARLKVEVEGLKKDKENDAITINKLKAEVTGVKKQNEVLTAENAKLKTDLENCKKTSTGNCNEVSAENAKLKAEVEGLKKDKKVVDDENAKLKAELANAKTELEWFGKENNQLKAEVEGVKKTNETLATENAKLKADLENCKKANVSADVILENTKLKAEVEGLKKDKEALVLENTKLKAEVTGLKENSNKNCAELSNENAKLKAEVEGIKKEKETLTVEVVKLKAEVEGLKKDKETLNGTIVKLTAQVEGLTKDKETLTSENVTLKAQVEGLKKKVSDLEAEILTLKLSKNDCSEKDAEIAKLKAEIEGLKTDLANAKTEVEWFGKENNKLKAEVSAKDKKISDLEIQLADCEKNSNSSEEVNKLKAEVTGLKKDNADLSDELNKLKSDLANAKSEVEWFGKENTTLKNQVSELKAKVADLEKKLANSPDCTECEQERVNLRGQVNNLTTEINNAKSDIESLRTENTSLRAQVVELKACCDAKNSKDPNNTPKESSEIRIKDGNSNSTENDTKTEVKPFDKTILGAILGAVMNSHESSSSSETRGTAKTSSGNSTGTVKSGESNTRVSVPSTRGTTSSNGESGTRGGTGSSNGGSTIRR